jgi:hypothetical protein
MSGSFEELSPLDTPTAPLLMSGPEFDQMLRERAYEIYLDRVAHGERGTPEADWMIAREEIGELVSVVD